jgi:hypothetical protein
MNYAKSNRVDGAWWVEIEEMDSDDAGYPPVEIGVSRNNGSFNPVCKVEYPDFDIGGSSGGNCALIAYAPRMYEMLKLVMEDDRVIKDMPPLMRSEISNTIKLIHNSSREFAQEANGEHIE